MFTGELISLGVAISWTATAMLADVASRRMGSLPLNVVRMVLSLSLLGIMLWLTCGVPYPIYADGQTWLWLCLSGFVGYVLGDYCLFQSYIIIGSRFGQLFMTLASPAAALTAWILLGESMTAMALAGMIVTMTGIGMSVLSKQGEDSHLSIKLPLRGVLMGIGAGVGQGVGLVLSKVGMCHYEEAISQAGITDAANYIVSDAIIPVSLDFVMPFASTMIRAVIGLIGFTVALFLFTNNGKQRLHSAATDGKGMGFAFGAAFFGPVVGVSLSLMATLYTSAGIAQTIMAMTPVFILLPSRIFFHQKITLLEVVGAVISVIGVSLFFV